MNRLFTLLILVCPITDVAADNTDSAKDATLEQLLNNATVKGKYRMLLRQFKVAGDEKKFGSFVDRGVRSLSAYEGHKDLPRGYWVYAAPYWYIWRDRTSRTIPKRQWGPEQATGKPDTRQAGDAGTAWASLTQDEQDEWLLCEYAKLVQPASIMVYENYMPGAVNRITAFKLDGSEVDIWKGKDPTPTTSASGISVFPIKMTFRTNRIKVYLDSTNVRGWNEIDAVGIKDKQKKTHWAAAVAASTTYAQQSASTNNLTPARLNERINELETEVSDLKETIGEMKTTLDELKKLLRKQK